MFTKTLQSGVVLRLGLFLIFVFSSVSSILETVSAVITCSRTLRQVRSEAEASLLRGSVSGTIFVCNLHKIVNCKMLPNSAALGPGLLPPRHSSELMVLWSRLL